MTMRDVNGTEIRVGDTIENILTLRRMRVDAIDGEYAWQRDEFLGTTSTETKWRIVEREGVALGSDGSTGELRISNSAPIRSKGGVWYNDPGSRPIAAELPDYGLPSFSKSNITGTITLNGKEIGRFDNGKVSINKPIADTIPAPAPLHPMGISLRVPVEPEPQPTLADFQTAVAAYIEDRLPPGARLVFDACGSKPSSHAACYLCFVVSASGQELGVFEWCQDNEFGHGNCWLEEELDTFCSDLAAGYVERARDRGYHPPKRKVSL